MNPTAPRSDTRSLLVPATPSEVYAAIRDPARIARWWGPDGFTNTVHVFEFVEGGLWTLTMHGPDGKDYPNESRFVRIEPDRCFAIEHVQGHHFILTLELEARDDGTLVHWQQTFDTVEHYQAIASFVATANQQNLERLAAEVKRGIAAA
ncbi:SRPBCC domain-containing protein [Leptothrix discophora]|uniref:SRPBCC domain-containing protein n=1 Tax=Leptothrix discophora TaxID=89 RepID=A0ABT9FZG9_LEPDI|nr:SRPBCC domain-containing protein [Leptothrix discophora]MDP4299343.1 SRPBCC domain-containing protein [Leptothrix discophora]